ncbi:MAG: BlaI/MecI/CopY family transcriptional regulator [Clostridium sp.]|nr:BlaI/MecI/CopY family transcriptional regulator [Clostridium sp.]
MKQLPQISEAEYRVMKVVWESAPISTNQVTDRLTQTTDWSPKTVHTLLKRLVSKGTLSYEKQSRVFIYTPLVEEADYLKQENSHFLQRFYNGNVSDMLTAFIKNDQLSQEDLEGLRRLLQSGCGEER